MQPTSLITAIGYARRRFPGETREESVRRINMVRSVMWESPEKRELVFRDEGREQVQQFRDFSNWNYQRCFTGITLPVNVTTAEYLDINGRRVPIESGMLDNLPAGYTRDRHRPTAMRLAVKVALKNDIPANNRGPVCFKCLDPKDAGKRVGVQYVTKTGAIVREDILISTSGPETTQVPVQILEVTLPQRCGWIRIATADDFELGSYHPSVISPKHIRLHINGVCCPQLVHWIGLCEPIDVMFDSDQVEMAKEFSWINAFTWVDLHLKTTKSKEELETYRNIAIFDAASAASDLKAEMGAPALNLRPRESAVTWRRLRSLNSRFVGGYGRRLW